MIGAVVWIPAFGYNLGIPLALSESALRHCGSRRFTPLIAKRVTDMRVQIHYHSTQQWPNKTDAGNGLDGICRVVDASRSPSPDPGRSPQKMISRRLLIPILGSSLILTTSPVNANESADLDKAAAKFLEHAASQAASKVSYEDGHVVAGGKRIKITPVSENVLQRGASHISAARFEVAISDEQRPELTFGSIGIGDSADDATKTAVVEWYMAAGKALFAAIGDDPAGATFPGFSIYPGLMGIRGERPEGWLDGTPEMNRRIFDALKDQIPAGKKLNAIDLKIVVNSAGAVDGQCIVNGKESEAALKELQKLKSGRRPRLHTC